ncbi:DNA-binding response regulator [candidate division KSB1 bacterium]|nr:response regulator transcription factor [candidate division KSB1 bacterium]RQW04391.1 MAG: DNA-binding response regulator [candidate division KSB1 bacterium]
MHILVIEDESKVAKALRDGLASEGYNVTVAQTGEDGFFLAMSQTFDLILLDLMLPGRSGIEILNGIRRKNRDVPVLILTAKDAIEDRVLGLDSGADDYLVKPFAFPELLARIRALTRRGRIDLALKLKVANLEMDCVTRKVTRDKRDILLTGKEFELLEYLMRHQGHVVSREMLVHDVWHVTDRATPLDNVIDVHVNRLRAKMDADFDNKLLHTIRGVGFILKEGDEP